MKQKANGVNSPPVEFSIEKGVVFGIYRNDLIIDLVTAKTIVKERLKFTNSKPYPYLIDDRGVKSLTKEARVYFASEESYSYITACGMLYNSIFSAMVMRILLLAVSPPFPVRMFANKADAVKWLKNYTNESNTITKGH